MKSVLVGRLIVPVAFLLLIEAIARAELVNPLFLAKPSSFIPALWDGLVSGEFLSLGGHTLYEVGITFVVSAFAGLALGYLMWRYVTVGATYEPILGALFASPIVLLYPIFLAVFGRTVASIMIVVAIIGFIPIAINTRRALLQVSPTLINVGRSFGLSEKEIFRHIQLPAAAPLIFAGLRLGLMYTMLGIVAMEYIVGIGGLGRFISDAAFFFRGVSLYAAIMFVFVLAALVFYGVRGSQRWIAGDT